MTDFWQGLIVAVCTNGLLVALVGFFLNRELQRQAKQIDNLNAIALARFSKFHCDAVDAIVQSYGLLVDVHNAVFRSCFPDWDGDETSQDDRTAVASAAMVDFYTAFRKSEILMSPDTSEQFESSFRVLQSALLKREPFGDEPPAGIQISRQVLADLTKTFPELLGNLRQQISKEIGSEHVPGHVR